MCFFYCCFIIAIATSKIYKIVNKLKYQYILDFKRLTFKFCHAREKHDILCFINFKNVSKPKQQLRTVLLNLRRVYSMNLLRSRHGILRLNSKACFFQYWDMELWENNKLSWAIAFQLIILKWHTSSQQNKPENLNMQKVGLLLGK